MREAGGTVVINGRLPASMLAPIPGGATMRKDAAAHLNLENFRLRAQGRPQVSANGSMSGYRDLHGQVVMRTYWCSVGKCGNAAVPGTSNHGWGIALDSNQAGELDGHNGPFDHRYSDAPWESWHRRDGHVSQTNYTPPKPTNPYPTLRRGHARSDAARTCQRLLREHGRSVKVDGDYGPRTRAAVKGFKANHGLARDEVCGPSTWHALRFDPVKDPTLKPGSARKHKYAVQEAQRLLRRCGRSVKVDGDYGPRTRAAVKGFKANHGLPHDEIVGKATWRALRRKASQRGKK